MSRLTMTIEDADDDVLDAVDEDEEFVMKPPSAERVASAGSRKRKAAAAPTSSSGFASALSFLSGLQSSSSLQAPLPAPTPALGSRTFLLMGRVQERLAMRQRDGRQDDDEEAEAADDEQADADQEDDDDDVDDDDGNVDDDDDDDSELGDTEQEGAAAQEEKQSSAGPQQRSRQRASLAKDRSKLAGQQAPASPSSAAASASPSAGTASGPRVQDWAGSRAALSAISDFAQLRLSRPLLRAVTELGWTAPTPVQSAVIPLAMSGGDVLANASTGSGKCFAAGTRLRLYDGGTVAVERVRGGERLMGDDGSARIVTVGSLARGRSALFTIAPLWDGAEAFTVNAEHILVLVNASPPYKSRLSSGGWSVQWFALNAADGLMQLRSLSFHSEDKADCELQRRQRLWSPLEWEVSVERFLAAPAVVRAHCRLFQSGPVTFRSELPRLQRSLSTLLLAEATSAQAAWAAWYIGVSISGKLSARSSSSCEELEQRLADGRTLLGMKGVERRLLAAYGLLDTARVPPACTSDSLEVRHHVLAGIIDGGALCAAQGEPLILRFPSRALCEDCRLLAGSLGIRSSAISGDRVRGFRVGLSGAMSGVLSLCALSAHRSARRGTYCCDGASDAASRSFAFRITKGAVGDYFGFAVSGANRRFLLSDFTVTHNTAAFMLPVLERLLFRPNRRLAVSRVLVLLPTRELAAQCAETAASLARHTDVRCCLVVGGLSMAAQEQALKQRPDIIVATPGRLIDHLRNTASVHLEQVEVLVLDEADRLLELGFMDELREILRLCPRQRQTLLFSATLSASVQDLILLSCKSPTRVSIDPTDAVVDRLRQEFIRVRQREGGEEEEREREAVLLSLCQRSFTQRVLVFTQTKMQCHRLFLLFSLFRLPAAELQGGLSQAQRTEALQRFSSGAVQFLICTDLASRGLDIAGISTVINVSMPQQLRLYIHRVGRTARAGRAGRAVTLVGFRERKALRALLKRSSGVLHARTVQPDVVRRYRQRIAGLEADVSAVLQQEREEAAERVTEMEINKARNQLVFQQEILSRPPKTWFQTQQEKRVSKEAGVRAFAKPADRQAEGGEQDGEEAEEETEEVETSSAGAPSRPAKGGSGGPSRTAAGDRERKKAKDPLRGLSRAQKRRKLMRMEAERAAAARLREARSVDPSVSADDIRVMDPVQAAATAAKAAKRQLKAQHGRDGAGGSSEAAGTRKDTKRKRARGDAEGPEGGEAEAASRRLRRRVVLMQEGREGGRFKASRADAERSRRQSTRRPASASGARSSGSGRSNKAFKSKSKHKRR